MWGRQAGAGGEQKRAAAAVLGGAVAGTAEYLGQAQGARLGKESIYLFTQGTGVIAPFMGSLGALVEHHWCEVSLLKIKQIGAG